ncbi:hypothetical protein CEXT_159011 [Caerostris extrusa]|uniref:Uncharacterized protein n=1 Tax=Caerostris extrusa TaxID=172846 RepID=A0AAV4XSE4_CAEEX|nr:hypothetical protein CEXT_159011 [Caerostris extrusa]
MSGRYFRLFLLRVCYQQRMNFLWKNKTSQIQQEIDLKSKQVGHPVLERIINIPTPQVEVILMSDSRCFSLVFFVLSEKKGKPLVGRKWQCRNEWEGKRARTDMEFHRRLTL